MALNKPGFIQELTDAFSQTTWAASALKTAQAIDNFIKSGTVNTTVNGVVVPPPPASPYPATGVGIGTITTTTLPVLQGACSTAFASVTWAVVGNIIADAISIHVMSAVVNMQDSNILVGTGIGKIAPAGIAQLQVALTTAFTTPGKPYPEVISDIANAVEAFLKSAQVTTTDSGVVPPNSWTGAGIGTIS